MYIFQRPPDKKICSLCRYKYTSIINSFYEIIDIKDVMILSRANRKTDALLFSSREWTNANLGAAISACKNSIREKVKLELGTRSKQTRPHNNGPWWLLLFYRSRAENAYFSVISTSWAITDCLWQRLKYWIYLWKLYKKL